MKSQGVFSLEDYTYDYGVVRIQGPITDQIRKCYPFTKCPIEIEQSYDRNITQLPSAVVWIAKTCSELPRLVHEELPNSGKMSLVGTEKAHRGQVRRVAVFQFDSIVTIVSQTYEICWSQDPSRTSFIQIGILEVTGV